jgi:hypothetical protein
VARAYNNALILVRFLGFYFVLIGIVGFTYIASAVVAQVCGAPEWLMEPPLYFAAQGVFGNPLYIVAGVILLWKSRAISKFIAKYCENEEAA